MLKQIMSGKIHTARLTGCDVEYEGSMEIDLECLEEMNLDNEAMDKFYETLEKNNVDVDVGGDDLLLPLDEVLPDTEDLRGIDEVTEEEPAIEEATVEDDEFSLPDTFIIDENGIIQK